MAANKYGVDIDDLRKEAEEIERRSSKGTYWTPKVGKNVVRLLPPAKPEAGNKFYFAVWNHWITAQGISVPCLNKMKGEKCYNCEKVERLRAAQEKKKANGLSAGKRYLLQVIDRKDPDAGVQIYNCGSTVFKGLTAIIDDEDWGSVIFDLEKGYDIVIERTGEGLDTKYPSIRARKDPSPAGVSSDNFIDLEKTITYATYEEMQAMDSADTAAPKEGDIDGSAESIPKDSAKPECYKQYDPDSEKCKDCPENFDCEIDTPPKA